VIQSPTGWDVSDNEYTSLAETRRVLRHIQAFSERAAEAAGLRPRQYQVLLMLRGLAPEHGASVSDLAEWLQVRHHTAVGLVDRMANRGLLQRQPDVLNGRRVLVSLTDDGRIALRALALQHRNELRALAPRLLEALRHVLEPPQVAGPNSMGMPSRSTAE
jgi:DNA-binding MarR family transcriptional regulator